MKTKRRLLEPAIICLILVGSLIWGGWTWYDNNVDRSGWKQKDGVRFYQDFYGDPVSGWLDIGENRYYFNEGGVPRTLWQEIDGNTYYMDPSGVMATSWQTIDGQRCYFGDDGVRRSGWLRLEEGTYYLPEGVMATSWQTIDGNTHYFTASGLMALGFASIEGERYYFGNDGVMVTGEQEILGNRYIFADDGAMHTGWLDTEEGRRHYLPDGAMATGWQTIANRRYLFEDNGAARTGWYREGEYDYYFLPDGAAAVGPTEIDGDTHYFSPRGMEVILVNAKHSVPDYYKTDLVTFVDWHRVDKRCFDALTQMLADCEKDGVEYEFNSGYRTIDTQKEILASRTREYMESYALDYQEARARALRTVAVPGTSEHHLGLAVDLLGEEAQVWLNEHCWDYGFIRRYAGEKENWTGIASEPWHFRYVGKEIAAELRDSGLSLEEYLGAEPVKG